MRCFKQVVFFVYAVFLLTASLSPLHAVSECWVEKNGGNWMTASNWTNCTIPNGVGDTATFGVVGGGSQTVTLNCTVTVGTMSFSWNCNRLYTLAGSGTLIFDACGCGPATLTFSNTSHDITVANIVLNDDLTITRNGSSSCIDSVISGTGGITKTGSGFVRLNGDNTYTGDNVIQSGGRLTLRDSINGLGNAGAGNCTKTTIESGGRLQFNITGSATLENENFCMEGTGDGGNGAMHVFKGDITLTGTVNMTASALVTVESGHSLEYEGVLSGGAGADLTKDGAGTLTLSAVNTSLGDFIIDQGTLVIGIDNAIVDSADIILNSGTLDMDGNSDTITNLTLNATSTLAFTSADASQDLNITALNLNGFDLNITGWDGSYGSSGTGGRLISTTSYTSTQLASVNFSGYANGGMVLDLGGGLYEIVPFLAAPESSALWGGTGMIMVAVVWHWSRRRRRKILRDMSE